MNKLGTQLQFVRDADAWIDLVQETQPAVVKLLADEPSVVKRVLDVAPYTTVILRQYQQNQDFRHPNIQPILKRRDVQAFGGHPRVRVEWLNEISGDWNMVLIPYLQNELKVATALAKRGIKFVEGSWSTGYPDLQFWRQTEVRKLLREMADLGAWIGLHEYGNPNMRANLDTDGTGWETLRYRKVHEALSGINMPLVITECGIDTAHGKKSGWRTVTNAQSYGQQLAWYADELAKDPYVVGATVFACQTDWDSFEVCGNEAEKYIRAYKPPTTQLCGAKDITNDLPKGPGAYERRDLSDIRYLVVHHTAVPPVPIVRIAEYHTKERKWPGIGYHFVVQPDGSVFETNHLTTVSYHARQYNRSSVGIALNGNFMKDPPPFPQIEGTARLVRCLQSRLGNVKVVGHRQLTPTDCPGDTFPLWRAAVGGKESPPPPHECKDPIGKLLLSLGNALCNR